MIYGAYCATILPQRRGSKIINLKDAAKVYRHGVITQKLERNRRHRDRDQTSTLESAKIPEDSGCSDHRPSTPKSKNQNKNYEHTVLNRVYNKIHTSLGVNLIFERYKIEV